MKTPFGIIRTGKQRLFVAFFMYSMVSLLVSVVSFSLFRKLEDLEKATAMINRFYISTLRGIKTGQDFFTHETTNEEFFRLGRSGILNEHYVLFQDVDKQREAMLHEKKVVQMLGAEPLHLLDSLLDDYIKTFHGIVVKIKSRGFRDHGLVGQMRDYAHKLENHRYIDQVNLLQIRRHEKDYIIRQDTAYMYKLVDSANQLRAYIKEHNKISDPEKEDLRFWLTRYETIFLQIVEIDLEVGQKERTGLSMMLKERTERINEIVRDFNEKANERYSEIFENFQLVTVIVVTVSVILTLLLSLGFKHILQDET